MELKNNIELNIQVTLQRISSYARIKETIEIKTTIINQYHIKEDINWKQIEIEIRGDKGSVLWRYRKFEGGIDIVQE